MRRVVVAIGLLCMIFSLTAVQTATAAPGLLMTASRDGFWSNQFPDELILLVHGYYYWADEFADDNGDNQDMNDTKVGINLYRLIKPWHFGDHNQYQYVLEGIFGLENVSIDNNGIGSNFNESGIMNPMIYTSIGWNNESQTTHLQFAVVLVAPYGDDDLKLNPGDDSYQVIVAGGSRTTVRTVLDRCVGRVLSLFR